jgi:hypothetical protein
MVKQNDLTNITQIKEKQIKEKRLSNLNNIII